LSLVPHVYNYQYDQLYFAVPFVVIVCDWSEIMHWFTLGSLFGGEYNAKQQQLLEGLDVVCKTASRNYNEMPAWVL